MLMHNPPHPGEVVRRQCLEPLGLTVTEAAKGLGISRNTLSMLAQRPTEDFPGDGHPPIAGFRWHPGKLAAAADAVRPVAYSATQGRD